MLARQVRDEHLDSLPPTDPRARRSRRDLRRVHAAMFTTRALLAGWRTLGLPDTGTVHVLELGAGDGRVLLPVARRLGASCTVRLRLLDRQDLLDDVTRTAYADCGWQVDSIIADVRDWADDAWQDSEDGARPDLITTSLFLHHFDGIELDRVLATIAERTDRCLAFEPRRSPFALLGSHAIGALGVNAVTRQDAVTSVRAGFTHDELSSRWREAAAGWQLSERAAPPFGHLFTALRNAVERRGP